MENLEQIKQELEELEIQINGANLLELKEMQKKLEKIIHSLIGINNYCRKQKNINLTLIREALKKAKNIELQIKKTSQSFKSEKVEEPKPRKKQLREEEQRINEIIKMDIDKTEKIKIIERQIKKLENHIAHLKREKKRNNLERKEYSTFLTHKKRKTKKERKQGKEENKKSPKKKNNTLIHTLDLQIQDLNKEISYQQHILSTYQNLLFRLQIKEQKANYSSQQKDFVKEEKENKAYYLIIKSLLEDDKNYLFLKKVVEDNANFLNARYNGQHILFDILDLYIENLKLALLNQKIVHKNPNYFYSLLKIWRTPLLNLTLEEENYFQSRIKELEEYVENKPNEDIIKQKLSVLKQLGNSKIIVPRKINAKIEQEFLDSVAKISKSRVNLTRDYLEEINMQVFCLQYLNSLKFEKEIGKEEIAKKLNLPMYDIKNSEIILDTVALEGTKYAISFGFSKNYETLIRMHILDTELLYEESPSLSSIKESGANTPKKVKKVLKFKKANSYPVITYQFKIEQGKVGNFSLYESIIKIDRVITNDEIRNYRNDEYLKNLVGNILILRNHYQVESDLINLFSVEEMIDFVINIELKKYATKNSLPVLYFTELEMEELDKVSMHYQICHYLARIPKEEATYLFKCLKDLKVCRFYGFVPVIESRIEFDTKNQVGYLNSLLLKCSMHGIVNGGKIELIEQNLKNALNLLEQEDLFIEYFNERKLIRKLKKEQLEKRKDK